MHFESEIEAPKDWAEVRIETRGAEEDTVDDLLAEIKQTGLRAVIEASFIVVRLGDDAFARRSFEEGVVPDLHTRGFRATWMNRSL